MIMDRVRVDRTVLASGCATKTTLVTIVSEIVIVYVKKLTLSGRLELSRAAIHNTIQ